VTLTPISSPRRRPRYPAGWPGFISLGPTRTGKTSIASLVCCVYGVEEVRAINVDLPSRCGAETEVRSHEACGRSVQWPFESRGLTNGMMPSWLITRIGLRSLSDHGTDGPLRNGSRVRSCVLGRWRSDAITVEGDRLRVLQEPGQSCRR